MVLSEKTLVTEKELPLNVLSKKSLKLIILSIDESIVEMADKVAQQTPLGVERIVVWIQNPDISKLKNQLPEISHFIDNCKAFSLSTINRVGLSISQNSSVNFIQLDRAFIKAGKSEIN